VSRRNQILDGFHWYLESSLLNDFLAREIEGKKAERGGQTKIKLTNIKGRGGGASPKPCGELETTQNHVRSERQPTKKWGSRKFSDGKKVVSQGGQKEKTIVWGSPEKNWKKKAYVFDAYDKDSYPMVSAEAKNYETG